MKKIIHRLLFKIVPGLSNLRFIKPWAITNSKIDKTVKLFTPYDISDCTIGAYSYLSDNSCVLKTTIGRFCSIGPNFMCGRGIHPTNGISTSPMFYSTLKQNGFTFAKENKIEEWKDITIGNDVFIGMNVTVLDGANIGDGAIIGAGAVVSTDIPAYAIAVGVPAKVIKYRFDKQTIQKLQEIKWWENLEDNKLSLVEKHFFDVEGFINEYSGKKK